MLVQVIKDANETPRGVKANYGSPGRLYYTRFDDGPQREEDGLCLCVGSQSGGVYMMRLVDSTILDRNTSTLYIAAPEGLQVKLTQETKG